MKKGITPIIGIIIMLLIVIALAGSGYTFLFGIAEASTSKTIRILPNSQLNDTVIIQNLGTSTINPGELKATVNGKSAEILNLPSIAPKRSAQVRINTTVYGERLNVRIMGPTNTVYYKVDIIG